MSTNLGKRKRRAPKEAVRAKSESEEPGEEELAAQEIFRRHFEAQFKPLPVVKKPKIVEEEKAGESEPDSEWDGLSEKEEVEDNGVQVVEHRDAQTQMAAMSKEELKAFMVGFDLAFECDMPKANLIVAPRARNHPKVVQSLL